MQQSNQIIETIDTAKLVGQSGGQQQLEESKKKPGADKQGELSNIILVPRFISGLKADVNGNIFFLDDNTVLYPAGHNIVLYNIEEKTQKYITGIEGSEGITALAVSKSKRWLAVCERGEKTPICCVYDLTGQKKRRVIVSLEIDKQNEFVSCAFSETNQEKMLATLTKDAQQSVYLWQWDKSKLVGTQQIQNTIGTGIHVSISNSDHTQVLVTGNSTFRYHKLQEGQNLKLNISQLNKKEAHISNHYTCHAWLPDSRLLVGTDQGDLILCEHTGEFKNFLQESPGEGFYIEVIKPTTKGFIIAGEKCQIMIYEKVDDNRIVYHKVASLPASMGGNANREQMQLMQSIISHRIKSLDLSSSEDTLIFTTENNQIIKMNINLERPTDDVSYDYLVYPFHARGINGMDTCIKKQLVATCSMDKTVKIWSYNQDFKLEINQSFDQEAFCVAFHPSGFHLIVGFAERICMMNVFQDNLQVYKSLQVKQCREIVFSNGGHLFACQNQSNIDVYKFYTAENPPHYKFKDHSGLIRSISWLDDDTGFVSSGWDATIFMWKLSQQTAVWEHKVKNVNYTCVTSYKQEGEKTGGHLVYATGTDKTIRELDGKVEKLRYEQPCALSQAVLMHNRRAIFTGVAEQNKPGSVQVLRYPYEKIFEIQAHALPVERLRISYDNSTLFSAGLDGTLCIFSIQEKDPRKKDKDLPTVQFSEEILIQKSQRDKLQADIEHLQAAIKQERINKQYEQETQKYKFEKKIGELQTEIESKRIENQNRYESLESARAEMERVYQERINQMMEDHEEELNKRIQDETEKIEADHGRYLELQASKEEQQKRFEVLMTEMYVAHDNKNEKMRKDHQLAKEEREAEKKKLSQEIERMITEHKIKREQVENQTWEDIDMLKERNKEEQAREIDKGMKQKGELTLIHNEYKNKRAEKDARNLDIQTMEDELKTQIAMTTTLRSTIESQKGELRERDTTIKDKDKKINDLKKKGQELEKFKFVLDYKIKELKREIGPKTDDIQKLNEQSTKMNQETKHFSRVNSNLKLIVEDLQLKQEGLNKEAKKLNEHINGQDKLKKQFKDDIFECLHHISDYKKLKKGIIRLHKMYVLQEHTKNEKGDTDMHIEQTSKRKYLEGNLYSLRRKLNKDQDLHKTENSRKMTENVMLLIDINELKRLHHKLTLQYTEVEKKHHNQSGAQRSGFSDDGDDPTVFDDLIGQQDSHIEIQNLKEEQQEQDLEIENLHLEMQKLEQDMQMLQTASISQIQDQQPPQMPEAEVDAAAYNEPVENSVTAAPNAADGSPGTTIEDGRRENTSDLDQRKSQEGSTTN